MNRNFLRLAGSSYHHNFEDPRNTRNNEELHWLIKKFENLGNRGNEELYWLISNFEDSSNT